MLGVAQETIYPHVFDNADREVGGVLIGRTSGDGGPPLITGAIPAISADERRATLTFTQDTWAHVHRTLDSDFPPDEQIVGWYHSHPGFGIFLSGHDLFIHRNFFGEPSQIAVVVDPVAGTEGAFVWREDDLVSLFERATPEQWVPTGARVLSVPTDVIGSGRVVRPAPSRYPILALVLAGVIGVLAGFGFWSVVAGGSSPSQPPPRAVIVTTRATHAKRQRDPIQRTSSAESPGVERLERP